MFVIPWWALLVVIVVLLYLIARVIDLSRRSNKFHDIIRKLEGAQNEEEPEKLDDSETGGFE